MKKRVISILTVLTLVIVVCLSSSTTLAANRHTHAYSDVGIIHLSTQQIGSHVVQMHDPSTGTYETVICYIYVETWAHVMKCGCGSTYYANQWTRIVHSACGL
ncbi:MAG: hypothetical protein IKO03_08460 [Lachnospiraceae bacterium]|nr:hypothetical protein [Lachnospiraceae bacterium]MBR4608369.1 hypothetical protein [Lachnospiraceae bacterium]MBR6152033.1 hypothetical protein [Lachnospiraceae bacterium]